VTILRRQHQRRRPRIVLPVDARAALNQSTHDVGMVEDDGGHQRRRAQIVGRVHVGAGTQQLVDDDQMSLLRRVVQGRRADVVSRVHLDDRFLDVRALAIETRAARPLFLELRLLLRDVADVAVVDPLDRQQPAIAFVGARGEAPQAIGVDAPAVELVAGRDADRRQAAGDREHDVTFRPKRFVHEAERRVETVAVDLSIDDHALPFVLAVQVCRGFGGQPFVDEPSRADVGQRFVMTSAGEQRHRRHAGGEIRGPAHSHAGQTRL
jgi:hypothetical protein